VRTPPRRLPRAAPAKLTRRARRRRGSASPSGARCLRARPPDHPRSLSASREASEPSRVQTEAGLATRLPRRTPPRCARGAAPSPPRKPRRRRSARRASSDEARGRTERTRRRLSVRVARARRRVVPGLVPGLAPSRPWGPFPEPPRGEASARRRAGSRPAGVATRAATSRTASRTRRPRTRSVVRANRSRERRSLPATTFPFQTRTAPSRRRRAATCRRARAPSRRLGPRLMRRWRTPRRCWTRCARVARRRVWTGATSRRRRDRDRGRPSRLGATAATRSRCTPRGTTDRSGRTSTSTSRTRYRDARLF